MYSIEQCNYHYYSELTDYLNQIHNSGSQVVQILEVMQPSGDNKKMHRATILTFKL